LGHWLLHCLREYKGSIVADRDPDERIYEMFAAGDVAALPALVRRCGAALLRFIHYCLGRGTAEDAEEVFNDTLLAVWREVGEYDPQRARFRTWVFLQARWVALDRRRALARHGENDPLPELAAAEFSGPLLLQLDLVVALEELRALDRQIIYLSDYLGLEHREIAERLGLKVGALDTRLYRARRRLRRALAAWRPRRVREAGHE